MKKPFFVFSSFFDVVKLFLFFVLTLAVCSLFFDDSAMAVSAAGISEAKSLFGLISRAVG